MKVQEAIVEGWKAKQLDTQSPGQRQFKGRLIDLPKNARELEAFVDSTLSDSEMCVCVCVFSLSRYQGPLASYKTLEKKLYCIGPEKEHQLPKITSSLQARIAAAWDLWTQKFHSGCSANSFQPARNKLSLPSFLAWSSSAFYKFTVFCPTLWIKSLNHNILKYVWLYRR